MPKPSDVFLGIIEFFAVLLPGALVTWILWRWPWPITAQPSGPFHSIAQITASFLPGGSVPRWVAFAVVSWGVGQILFAAAPPIDWAWDWFRHRQRIKNNRLTDRADKAVVALRFALLGLAFPAVTDPPSRWFQFAWPKFLPVILAVCLISPVSAFAVYILLGWRQWGCSLSTIGVIGLVVVLSCWFSYWKKCWEAKVAVAEKEATREHADWAEQYLRQMNMPSFLASAPLSAIKGAAKETEEAAGKLQQTVKQLANTGRIDPQQRAPQQRAPQQRAPDIYNLLESARELQELAGSLQQTADSAHRPLEQAVEASIDLQVANDAADHATKAFGEARSRLKPATAQAFADLDQANDALGNLTRAFREAKSRLKQAALGPLGAVQEAAKVTAGKLEQIATELENTAHGSPGATQAPGDEIEEIRRTAQALRNEGGKLQSVADSINVGLDQAAEKVNLGLAENALTSAKTAGERVGSIVEQAKATIDLPQAKDTLDVAGSAVGEAISRLDKAVQAAIVAKGEFDAAEHAVEAAKSQLGCARNSGRTPGRSAGQALRQLGEFLGQRLLPNRRRYRTAKRRLEEAKDRLILAAGREQKKKKGVETVADAFKQQIDGTEIAKRNTIDAAGRFNDPALQAAVTAVQTAFAGVTGGAELALRRVIEFSRQKRPPSREAIGNYDFACAVLRARAPAALAEVERLQAQSKFFRSLTTGIFFISYGFLVSWEIRQIYFPDSPRLEWPIDPPWPIIGAVGVSLALSILLYHRMRKNAVGEAYKSAVAAFALGGKVDSGSALKGGAQG
jgi:hypothetical protein